MLGTVRRSAAAVMRPPSTDRHDVGPAARSLPGEGGPLPSVVMKVEVLYFDGCPNHEALLPHLRELLESHAAGADIELVRVQDADAAERERFLGSPTVRVDGEDVEPGAGERTDFGLKCRLFATPGGRRGMPTDEWVLAALERARTPSG
jgi:hypothetical protein